MISGLHDTADCFIHITYYPYSWCGNDMKFDAILIAGPTASGKSALALDLAERLGGSDRQMPTRCRSIATCTYVSSAAASERRGTGEKRHTGSTAMSMRRRTIRSGAGCADVARGARRGARGGARADPGRRHRALFQGADAGALRACRRCPRRSAPRCARGCEAEGPAALHAELARRDPDDARR